MRHNALDLYVQKHRKSPTTKDISERVPLGRTAVYNYLVALNDAGRIEYDGKTILTPKTRGILTGTIRDSRRNIVLMNAGAAIYCGGGAASLEEGVKKAAEVIDNGKAMEVLENYVRLSNEAD